VCSGVVYAQHHETDTAFIADASLHLYKIHAQALGINARLYNGMDYSGYWYPGETIGHPYWSSNQWGKGSIEYDGQLYPDVEIMYDVMHDKVVINNPYSRLKLELITEKVKGFILHGHQFRNVLHPGTKPFIPPGIYDILCEGGVSLYAKRTKTHQQSLGTRSVVNEFREATRFYISRGDFFYSVNSKNSLLKVLADEKSQLRKYILKNKISFTKNREQAFLQVTRFFNELKNQI
jgi:hypothetical protein